ncbi:MAG: bifunctional phosphopantothenoylcysteine decarboxylase/phosphopantothenate--cysteine ligase CoaBC [Acidimicrobiia bacterium]
MESSDQPLKNKNILLCVSASISAYKSIYLLRKLAKLGANVRVATTPSTNRFVGEQTFSALSCEPAYGDLWDARGSISHTKLANNSDLVVVYPATASLIAKIANGFADEIVTASLLSNGSTPVIICPAMHDEMYENLATQENIATLQTRGYEFVGPVVGELAGGDQGIGRLVDDEVVVEAIVEHLKNTENKNGFEAHENIKPIKTKSSKPKMLITAGGTKEAIDPVRFISNNSTGKMGHAIASAANSFGYEVTLVTTSDIDVDEEINLIKVQSAEEMFNEVMKNLDDADVVVMTAAVADLTPVSVSKTKLKRKDKIASIDFKPTVDIVEEIIKNKSKKTFVACFAAESNDVLENSKEKFISKKVDMLFANDISNPQTTFGSDMNEIYVFTKSQNDPIKLDLAPKIALAFDIVEIIESNRHKKY